jgi:hypothetical protein
VAIDAVSRFELSFEIGSPDVVRCGGHGRDHARMQVGVSTTTLLDEATSSKEVTSSAHGWQGHGGESQLHPLENLLGAPSRVAATSVADGARYQRVDAVGTYLRSPTTICEAVASFLFEAHDPLVTGLAADSIARAELEHAEQAELQVGDESFSLFHW